MRTDTHSSLISYCPYTYIKSTNNLQEKEIYYKRIIIIKIKNNNYYYDKNYFKCFTSGHILELKSTILELSRMSLSMPIKKYCISKSCTNNNDYGKSITVSSDSSGHIAFKSLLLYCMQSEQYK